MERARVRFSDRAHPALSGSLVLDDGGRVVLKASPDLVKALRAGTYVPAKEIPPLRFDSAIHGLALTAALAKGVHARLLEFDFASGALEIRATVGSLPARLTLRPGDFDPDEAWEFLLATNDAKLEAPRA